METSTQDPVGTQNPAASGASEKKDQDMVAYQTYQKVLQEKKARDERLAEYEAKLKQYEQSDLERKGQYDSLISQLKEENNKLKQTVSERDRAYIMSKVNSAIATKALEAGCRNTDKLLRLIDKEKIESLEVDENYNVDMRSVEFLINEAKQENDFLFKNSRVNVTDANPVDRPVVAPEKQVKDMTMEEIKNLYKQTYKR